MLKSSRTIWMCAAILVIASLVLTACGGGAAPATLAPQPAQAPTEKPTESAKPTEAAMEKPTEPAAKPIEVATEQPTAAPSTAFVSKPSGRKTSTGFECPEPQPKSRREVNRIQPVCLD